MLNVCADLFQLCEDNDVISRLTNVTHIVMTEDYLYRDRPVIVTDALIGWEASRKFNLHFLNEVNAALHSNIFC